MDQTSLPDIVYKYFNWQDPLAKRILTEREMYFCNANRWKNFGEYDFDFKKPNLKALHEEIEKTAYRVRNKDFQEYRRWVEHHINLYKIDIGDPSALSPIELELWEVRVVNEITKHRAAEMLDNTSEYAKSTRKFFFEHTGIYSTSLINNSAQLWGWKQTFKHVNNGAAICIGLNMNRIKTQLDQVGNYSIGMVNYKAERNEVELAGSGSQFLIDRLNHITLTLKGDAVKDLSDQEELRILKFLTGDVSDKSPDRFMTLEPDAITEVIVHTNTSDNEKEEITAIARRLDCAVTIAKI